MNFNARKKLIQRIFKCRIPIIWKTIIMFSLCYINSITLTNTKQINAWFFNMSLQFAKVQHNLLLVFSTQTTKSTTTTNNHNTFISKPINIDLTETQPISMPRPSRVNNTDNPNGLVNCPNPIPQINLPVITSSLCTPHSTTATDPAYTADIWVDDNL